MTNRMMFRYTLPEDGTQRLVDVELPVLNVQGPGAGLTSAPAAAGQAMAKHMVRSIAAQIEPHLPAARPARSEIQYDRRGRQLGTIEYPATPPPAIRAAEIARGIAAELADQYAAAVAAEQERQRQERESA